MTCSWCALVVFPVSAVITVSLSLTSLVAPRLSNEPLISKVWNSKSGSFSPIINSSPVSRFLMVNSFMSGITSLASSFTSVCLLLTISSSLVVVGSLSVVVCSDCKVEEVPVGSLFSTLSFGSLFNSSSGSISFKFTKQFLLDPNLRTKTRSVTDDDVLLFVFLVFLDLTHPEENSTVFGRFQRHCTKLKAVYRISFTSAPAFFDSLISLESRVIDQLVIKPSQQPNHSLKRI